MSRFFQIESWLYDIVPFNIEDQWVIHNAFARGNIYFRVYIRKEFSKGRVFVTKSGPNWKVSIVSPHQSYVLGTKSNEERQELTELVAKGLEIIHNRIYKKNAPR